MASQIALNAISIISTLWLVRVIIASPDVMITSLPLRVKYVFYTFGASLIVIVISKFQWIDSDRLFFASFVKEVSFSMVIAGTFALIVGSPFYSDSSTTIPEKTPLCLGVLNALILIGMLFV